MPEGNKSWVSGDGVESNYTEEHGPPVLVMLGQASLLRDQSVLLSMAAARR